MISVQSAFLVLILAAFGPASTLAQIAPAIEWQKSFGGNGLDIAKSVKQTSDGGYIIGGDSLSNVSGNKTNAGFGGSDYWL